MSVQQEPMKMSQTSTADTDSKSNAEQPPKLEYNAHRDESLSAYGSAVGGAVLGVLLTLLVLAVINGGTLQFSNQGELAALQASLSQIDRNLGTVNQNVESVAQRLNNLESEGGVIAGMQENLGTVQASLGEMDQAVDDLDTAVATLNVTKQQFDVFTAALASALSEMGVVTSPQAGAEETSAEPMAAEAVTEDAAEETGAEPMAAEAVTEEAAEETGAEPMAAEAVTEEAAEETGAEPMAAEAVSEEAAEETGAEPVAAEEAAGEATAEVEAVKARVAGANGGAETNVASSADVPADAVQVYLFADENGNGILDEDEASLIGLTVTLTPAEGEAQSVTTTDSGALFEGLAADEYTIAVEDTLGFTLAGESQVAVDVAEDADEGQIVYFPVTAGASTAE